VAAAYVEFTCLFIGLGAQRPAILPRYLSGPINLVIRARCRINIDRAKRPKQLSTGKGELAQFFKSSRAKCFFCSENIEKMTPTLAGKMPERTKVGESWLFPNLFSFAGFHAVAVFSSDHHLELNQFASELIEDCFKASFEYLKLIKAHHSEVRYWSINWNYMSPAAASIVHPHLQVIADPNPSQYVLQFLDASKSYYERERGNYWRDLMEVEEHKGERFIGRIGSVNWLVSFATQGSARGNRKVQGIFSNISSLAQLGEKELDELSTGLYFILRGYYSCRVKSLNMATFSSSCDDDLSDFFLLNVSLILRPSPAFLYVNDNSFMETFHREPIAETIPEDLSRELKRSFPE
jgi:UDPglucose--hexose-1-phosphate uridylyltransferase